MNLLKSVGIHVALTVAATATAATLWTKDEEPANIAEARVRVWPGTAEQFEKASFEGDDLKVTLEPKQDELGRYFVVNVDKIVKKSKAPRNPHAPAPEPEVDDKEPGKRVQRTFISVTEGNSLVDTMAPLQALRAVGRVDKDREEEFGFDKPEGKLVVKIAGNEHKLLIGGLTPGGGDRYVRLSKSHEAYAVPGEALRGFLHPESRLMETQLHGFDMEELRRIKVSQGKQSRELLRLKGKASGWASLDAPEEQDETASNWMTKVYRLRVSEYIKGEPKGLTQDSLVLRIDYFDDKKTLGFMELFKVPAAPGSDDRDKYLVRTEHTRWYAETLASIAEQVERDLGSVLSGEPSAKAD